MGARRAEDPLSVPVLKKAARALRAELPASAAEADARNIDVGYGMRRLWQEGFFDFNLPRRYGGISDADPTVHTEDFFATLIDIVAGDSSVGMNFVSQSLVTLEIFDARNGLPEATKQAMARMIHEDGVRLVVSNAETGTGRAPVTGRRADGGIVVNGSKSFNTNSGGGGWANVGIVIEGHEGQQEDGRWQALIPLDDPGVTCHHDWNVMGQRGTHSQTIDYRDVWVPDGYFYRRHVSPAMAGYVFLAHSAIMLGTGYGAFDAAVAYVADLDRPTLAEFSSAQEDPLIRRRIGEFAVDLQTARAFLLASARAQEDAENSYASPVEAIIEAFAVKVASVRAALAVTAGIFDLTGARSTAARYGFDRFWRNARTFSTHDPIEAKHVWIGDWYLRGKQPPVAAMLRV
jgi:alkylation response protein AidB-like acyl-CoA dehydrogenase